MQTETMELVFDVSERGFNAKAFYLKAGSGDALVVITKDGKPLREFLYPAYKIWNIQAHFSDIVDGELKKSPEGYLIAGSDGLGGCSMPKPIQREE